MLADLVTIYSLLPSKPVAKRHSCCPAAEAHCSPGRYMKVSEKGSS